MGDPYFNNVKLLIAGNGANGSTTFTDSSFQAHPITRYGEVVVSNAQTNLGENTISFDGDKDALKIDPSSDWQFTINEPFTIEGWFYLKNSVLTNNAANYLITALKQTSPTDYGWFLRTNRGGNAFFNLEFTIYELEVSPFTRNSLYGTWGHVTLDVWHHFAVSYDGTTFYLFLDGNLEDSITRTLASFSTYTNPLWIGVDGYWDQDDYSCLDGYAQYIRITKNVARYTTNFIPPVAADYLPLDSTGQFIIVGGESYNDGNKTYTHALLDHNYTIMWTYDHGAYINDVAVDKNNNCFYVVGGRSSYDNISGRKHSESGQVLFDIPDFGTYVNAVCVDKDGNFYIGGPVNPSNITHKKYSSTGTLLWEKSHGAEVFSLITDSSNNLYIGGRAANGMNLRKYSSNGDVIWSASWNNNNGIYGIAVDDEEFTYTASARRGGSFDPVLLAKWDVNGDEVWAVADSDNFSYYDKLIIDQNSQLYTLSTGESISIVIHDKNGQELWRGSPSVDYWGGLTIDPNGLLIVVGCQTGNNFNVHDKFHGTVTSLRFMEYLYAVGAYKHFTVPLPENPSDLYNHTSYLFYTGQVQWGDDLQVVLVNNSYLYQATHTSYSDIASYTCGEPVSLANKTLNNTALFSNPVKVSAPGTQPNAFVLYKNATVGGIDRPLLLYSAFIESFQPISVYDSLTITGNPWLQLN